MSDVPVQLGKYQIRRAIGKGAMGIVYEGFDPIIDRIVAIKTIKKDELDLEEAEEHSRRFLIEAKAAGRLNHKNIVGIYDYGEEKGLSFIVMEFVQGKELKSFFAARHPFSMSQIARLMGELLDALGYSHSRGVVHRDVKPDNIFVTDDGSVKLGDFGIARIDSTSKTHAGTVLGTPSYMSPEQIRGETADARSDLYAAGVILYQFLVGERPFSGGMVAVMQKVLMEMPRAPSEHNPSIPEAIDAVVLKALAKQPDQRYQSASEFSRELTAAVGLSNDEDESESTMIMTTETLKALQDGERERTSTGSTGSLMSRTGGTHTGTGTGISATGSHSAAGSPIAPGRAGALEEARRRADEAKRRAEEEMRRAEVELQEAEEEQRVAEVEAQSQADEWLKTSQGQLDEAAAHLAAAQALFTQHTLLIGGPDASTAGRGHARKLRESVAAIGAFTSASYALSPASQGDLEARQAKMTEAASAQDSIAEKIDHDAAAAHASLNQKLEVLEKRLAGQDGAWGTESRALEALDPAQGEQGVDPIQGRLDKLATSVDQVAKGFGSLQQQTLKLPPPQLERMAVIEAQIQAQAGFVTRLRMEADAARVRAREALEARRKAEEARIAAEKAAVEAKRLAEEAAQAAARKKAEEEARLKAEAEAKRLAELEARRKAEEAARIAAEKAAAEARRLAEEAAQAAARKKAEEEARLKAEAEAKRLAELEAKRKADEAARIAAEKAAAEAKRLAEQAAQAAARKKAEDEARLKAEAEAKRKADEAAEAARKAAEAEKKRLAEAAEAKRVADEKAKRVAAELEARRKAEEDARKKAEADAKRAAEAEAKRAADAEARRKADELAKQKADEEARKKAEAEAKRKAEADAKAKAEADAKAAKAEAERKSAEAAEAARRQAGEDARRAAASDVDLPLDDAEATMVHAVGADRDADDAEATMVRPIDKSADKPAEKAIDVDVDKLLASPPKPPVEKVEAAIPPKPASKATGGMKLPIIGVAIVVIAAGAWFALRPSPPAGDDVASAGSSAASAPAATPAPPPPAVASAPSVEASQAAVQPPAPAPSQPVEPPVVQPDPAKVAADQAAAAKHADDLAAKKSADDEAAKKKADDVATAKKALADAKADAKAKAKADADAVVKAKPDTDNPAKAETDKAAADAAKAEAADLFRKGNEVYQAGRVPEGVRQMERADAMGAPGARARLCAIYRKPTAAEGKDFLKEANKCKGVE